MTLDDVFPPAAALIDLAVPDKARLLALLAKAAAPGSGLIEAEISAALQAREALGSTGIGGGIALPHARFAGLAAPTGIVARLRRRIDFAAIDGAPVDLVVLLLLPPAGGGEPLNALAAVARRLREADTLQALRAAKSPVALRAALLGRAGAG
jgi:PTS system nitrogen regulatory IIA component